MKIKIYKKIKINKVLKIKITDLFYIYFKVYGIPSSTLYKIARKEKIELAQPFNAVQTTWTQGCVSSR